MQIYLSDGWTFTCTTFTIHLLLFSPFFSLIWTVNKFYSIFCTWFLIDSPIVPQILLNWVALGFNPVPEFIDPRFRENKPKTLVFSHWKQAFWACFRENWVYNFGHGTVAELALTVRASFIASLDNTNLIHNHAAKKKNDQKLTLLSLLLQERQTLNKNKNYIQSSSFCIRGKRKNVPNRCQGIACGILTRRLQ